MGLEDIAEFRALNGSTVLYPSDGNQTVALVRAMADLDGIAYLRTTRADRGPVREGRAVPRRRQSSLAPRTRTTSRSSPPGSRSTRRCSAADALAEEGISARVIDCYSIKPIDGDALAGREACPIVTVEDHRAEGGLGEAVLSALAERGASLPVTVLAVRALPQSGPPAALLAEAGIDAEHIAEAARAAVRAAVAG